MKKLFQKWLFVFVSSAFFITFIISWLLHSHLARQSAEELLRANLVEVASRVRGTSRNLETVIEISNHTALAKARAFARIVAENPGILEDKPKLHRLIKELDVDELHASDATGILTTSLAYNPDGKSLNDYNGFDMASTDQSAAFLEAITNPDFALVQEPQPNGILGRLFQYAGVARIDQPGIIQIGYHPARIEEAMKVADVNAIAATTRIGHHGTLTITPNDGSCPAEGKVFTSEINGAEGLSVAVPCEQYILTATLPQEELYLSRNAVIRILIIGNLVLFAVIFLLVSRLLQNVVITGIYSVNDKLGKIAEGNLNEKVEINTTMEFVDLSYGINTTVNALKHAIENEAKRIDAELEMGRTIQTSVLPTDFPDTAKYSIAAMMNPAREVGGDFYDFFTLEDGRQVAIIADVSGKGITAALFMMNAKALIKEMVLAGSSLQKAVTLANEKLSANNQANMFLTAFFAVLDPATGTLTCVNAGHNPPLLKRADGSCEFIKVQPGIVLGITDMVTYTEQTLTLQPGDYFCLYTDGVTEAMNSRDEQYSDPRLLETLRKICGSPAELLQAIRADVAAFVGEAPQSDDITMLILQYK